MGCSTCGSATQTKKTSDDGHVAKLGHKNQAFFNTKFGKAIYFLATVVMCITPVINVIGLYFFWKAIYGNNGGKVDKINEKFDGKINKDKDNA